PAPGAPPRAAGREVDAVSVPASGGVTLAGWLAHAAAPTAATRAPLVIYFGGNAEEVSWMVGEAPRLAPWSLLAVNYRGYGGNAGTPGEEAMFADALALHDWAAARPEVDPRRIILMGRSLGSGVAVHVAAHRRTAGAVLVTPFDSLRAVAQGIYPLVPVALLLRHPFDSLARAPAIDAPLLALVATHDRTVPLVHARRLFEAWRGPKRWLELTADHNSIDSLPAYWDAIAEFLRSSP
ncbi:MAG: alpha/beta hydrolase, partial [Betaproteobacteria bacterium]|nr:alpha/beta hydrolase [Betaproteobacteria bacterium]